MKPRIVGLIAAASVALVSFGTSRAQVPSAPSEVSLRADIGNLYGPTGLVKIPTSGTVDKQVIEATFVYGDQFAASGNYGIWDDIEVGLGVLDKGEGGDMYLLNGKINILPSNFKYFNLGLGFIDLLDDENQTFYGVASFDLWSSKKTDKFFSALRGHAGYGTGFYQDSLIGGAELFLGRKISGILEYDGDDANFAARYVHSDPVRLEAGWADSHLYVKGSFAFRP